MLRHFFFLDQEIFPDLNWEETSSGQSSELVTSEIEMSLLNHMPYLPMWSMCLRASMVYVPMCLHANMVYMPTCQKHANFSFLRAQCANKHANLL